MINSLRISKSYPFDLLPGDIDLKETPEEMFYNVINNNWVSYTKYNQQSKIFHRTDYRGHIPFEFSQKLLKKNNLPLGIYFLGRDGSWNDGDLKKVASMHEQKLNGFLYNSITEIFSQFTDQQNANYYDPLEITHRILKIKQ